MKRRSVSPRGGRADPAERPQGEIIPIPDANARLRIEVPPKIPIQYNAQLASPVDREEPSDADESHGSVYRIACRRDDRITICNNIVIVVVEFHRFVFADSLPAADPGPQKSRKVP